MFVKKAHELARERVRASVAKAAEFRREFRRQLLTIVATAFGVVAALFWQTAIRDTINAFVPQAEVWWLEILVALAVTGIAVLALAILSSFNEKQAEKTSGEKQAAQ